LGGISRCISSLAALALDWPGHQAAVFPVAGRGVRPSVVAMELFWGVFLKIPCRVCPADSASLNDRPVFRRKMLLRPVAVMENPT
jgi:hypothetical protein